MKIKTMNYSKSDLKQFRKKGIKARDIDSQLAHFEKGFEWVRLTAPATVGDGIIRIPPEKEGDILMRYEQACPKLQCQKMVPASGSATRMFRELFRFMDSCQGSEKEFLDFMQSRKQNDMYHFFLKLDELPFYTHLKKKLWETGKDLDKMLAKRAYTDILKAILGKKGLNYGNTPKGLIDFHVYRDFTRTAFDEHIAEGALYCRNGEKAALHFTVSEEHLPLFKSRLKKITKVFEKRFRIRYEVTFSVQKPSTDTVSTDAGGNILRDKEGQIVFRPGGHGALIHNLNELKADLVFIKNIDNVVPDRSKEDTVKYKKLLAGTLLELQEKISGYLRALAKKPTPEQLAEIEAFLPEVGYRETAERRFKNEKERIKHLQSILDRPIRVCGMVKNEGEPGGGPFWVTASDGSTRLMIVESAQIQLEEKAQKEIFDRSTHFNPVDLVCGLKNYKGKKFNLTKFIDSAQGFITHKSYQGQEIRVQELPGLWNGSMAHWLTVFVEVPLSTFTPVKTVFDLFRIEHRNVLKK